jgi:S1-C subfamily serine protease
VEIVEVATDSPAEHAGLRVEDLVVELNGAPVASVDDIQRAMTEAAIGNPVSMRVLRGERLMTLTLAPVELVAR